MARPIRKKSGTGIYHVMLRGIKRQDIFENDEDYCQMLSILKGLTDRSDEQGLRLLPCCSFYAYCLMSNHVHLLLQEREEHISEVVKRIGVTYAHYFNKKYERNGHLFQDKKPVSDSDVKAFMLKRHAMANPLLVQSLEKTRRNEVLMSALAIGAGIRQLSRFTGVSFGVIQKLKNDH